MHDMVKKIKNNPYTAAVLLFLIIAAQIINIVVVFVSEKTEYHCDELYSFGLSNSFYRPFVENDNIRSLEFDHIEEWFPGELYRDYLTVQKGEQFRYDSVWYNQGQDRHPPLFYSIIHTICSFAPDTFSFWFGFVPNLVYFAVMQFFLYKLAKNVLKSKYLALLFCLFWGFTVAALNNTLFIRMYCMLTMWTVILMYLHSKLVLSKEKIIWKQLIPLTIVTALGALTQYLFLFVAFVIAVCFCLWYLINKCYKSFFAYGASMLVGVLLFFLIYPKGFAHMFTESGETGGDLARQSVFSVRYIFMDLFCISNSDVVWLSYFLPPFIGILIILSLPVLFLFRDKLRRLPGKIRADFSAWKENKTPLKETLGKRLKERPVYLSMFISTVLIVMIVSYQISFIIGFANRYLYIIYPFAGLLIFALLCNIFRRIKPGKIVLTAITAALLLNIAVKGSIVSYWTYNNDISLHDMFTDSNVVVIVDNDSTFSCLSTFAYELYNTDQVFVTDYADIEKDLPDIAGLESDSPVYIMMYTSGSGTDDKGRYVSNLTWHPEKDQYIFDRIYCDELFGKFADAGAGSDFEYKGEYVFIEGDYYIYKIG